MLQISKTPYLILFAAALIAGCSSDEQKLGKPVAGTSTAMTDFTHFWSYYSNHIKFYKDFEAFDVDSRPMPMDSFMARYSTGQYIVEKYIARDTVVQYKLAKLKPDAEETIKNQLRSQAYGDYRFYLKKGKPLAGFDFKDIDGKAYTSASSLGKYVVVKFWFIGCKPCVDEMPELNAIVAKNRDRDDVVFISIAPDAAPALRRFFTRQQFDYHTVADKKAYILDTMAINAFPTHLVVDKSGKVMGLCNSARELKDMLSKTSAHI